MQPSSENNTLNGVYSYLPKCVHLPTNVSDVYAVFFIISIYLFMYLCICLFVCLFVCWLVG